eukprot:superscaffoldBa00006913_g22023
MLRSASRAGSLGSKSLGRMLSTTEGLHKYLQRKDVDLAQATLNKDAVLETLKSMWNDETAENISKEAKVISEANNLSETPTVQRCKQKGLEDYVVESSSGTRAHSDDESS